MAVPNTDHHRMLDRAYCIRLPPGYLGCCTASHLVHNYDSYRTSIIARLKTLEGFHTSTDVMMAAEDEWDIIRSEGHPTTERTYKAWHTRRLKKVRKEEDK